MIIFTASGDLAQARSAVERATRVARPDGKMGQAVMFATVELHRYAVSVTHVDTGTLRGAQRMTVSAGRGKIFVGSDINPRSHRPASRYAVYEHGRGGDHAFYERTIAEAWPGVGSRAIEILKGGL